MRNFGAAAEVAAMKALTGPPWALSHFEPRGI